MNSYKVEDPLDYMARLCKSRIKNGGDDNFHIFINSVEGIAKIIRRANLSPSDCRIVCSRSESSLSKNKEKLPSGFEIQTTTDPVKLFNPRSVAGSETPGTKTKSPRSTPNHFTRR